MRGFRDAVAQFCALALAIAGCQRPSADAGANDETFYRGRTVRIIVGVTPGGGQDLYARVMAPHWARQLPGAPNVIVENMPGAGGLVAATYLAHRRHRRVDDRSARLNPTQSTGEKLLDVRTAVIDRRGRPPPAVCVFGRERSYTSTRGGDRRRRASADPTCSHRCLWTLGATPRLPIKPVSGYPVPMISSGDSPRRSRRRMLEPQLLVGSFSRSINSSFFRRSFASCDVLERLPRE